MSTVFNQTEPVLAIPVKFMWNYESTALTSESATIESPLFGPTECFDSSTKFRLHCKRNQSRVDQVFLELVSCSVVKLELQCQIIYQNSTKSSTGYRKISIGEQISVWLTNYVSSRTFSNVQCEISYIRSYGYKSFINGLSTDLNTLRKDSNFTDVVFRIESQKLPAHKNILSARSPVFKAMFCNKNYVENQNGSIEITDMTSEEMESLLEFVYSGQLENLDKMAPNLLASAHKACELSMTNSIVIDNAAVYLAQAEMYNLKYLKAKALKFINENPNSVMQTDGWTKLIDNNNALLKDLYKGMSVGKN